MKWLTVLYRDDGSVGGVLGREAPIPDAWEAPVYFHAGDPAPRRFIAVHLGVGQMPGGGRCVTEDLYEAIESHPDSTPSAPKFGIKDMALMPQIHDAPCLVADFPTWMRANDPRRLPLFFRAWMTLTMPELAATYGLARGVSIEDLLDVEARRVGVRPEHSRLPKLRARRDREPPAALVQAVERNRLAVQQRQWDAALRATTAPAESASPPPEG
jgi:hypothetical protein